MPSHRSVLSSGHYIIKSSEGVAYHRSSTQNAVPFVLTRRGIKSVSQLSKMRGIQKYRKKKRTYHSSGFVTCIYNLRLGKYTGNSCGHTGAIAPGGFHMMQLADQLKLEFSISSRNVPDLVWLLVCDKFSQS